MDTGRDDEHSIGPALTALEARLSGWRPAAVAIDRDRLLYDAGHAAAGAGARQPWRLTAASLPADDYLGLAALAAREHSSLARERDLLARERSQRRQLETALAARAVAPQSAPAPQEVIEPPGPSSYLALSARMADGLDDPLSRGAGIDPAPTRSAPAPAGDDLHPGPLRPRDVRRVLEL